MFENKVRYWQDEYDFIAADREAQSDKICELSDELQEFARKLIKVLRECRDLNKKIKELETKVYFYETGLSMPDEGIVFSDEDGEQSEIQGVMDQIKKFTSAKDSVTFRHSNRSYVSNQNVISPTNPMRKLHNLMLRPLRIESLAGIQIVNNVKIKIQRQKTDSSVYAGLSPIRGNK